MKLIQLRIKNYRSCKDVMIKVDSMHALVGANNAGKSTILRALDFLFNPTVSKVDEESFWNHNVSEPIWIEAIFGDLNDTEKEKLQGYLRPEGVFHMARSARITDEEGGGDEDGGGERRTVISQHFCLPVPKYLWLRDSEINGTNINQWWLDRDSLVFKGVRFDEFAGGTKPNVGKWKELAKAFIGEHLSADDYEDCWADNPRGYAGVLKGTLPLYILVPAVRDVTEEAKVTRSNPLGRILYAIIEKVTHTQRESLNRSLVDMRRLLNREGGTERMASIADTESRLNQVLREYMDCELEIEFQPPTLEALLTTPRLMADDGYRNVVENKGHGLQRAIIFSILRCYSELVTGRGEEKARTLIFAVEEPELYMHPQAQRTIRRVFRNIADGGDQVFFSTHSALLVDVAYFDEIIRIEAIIQDANGARTVTSKVWQLSMVDFINDVKARHPSANPTPDAMRELYANAYHPTRAEGFFARKVILVEGATEQYSLPIYALAAGLPLDNLNVAVVECGGKGPMDRLYRVFNELGIPCYLIFDYDGDKDDAEIVEISERLLKIVGGPSGQPATTLITETLAVFPRDWEQDLRSEISDYESIAREARKVLGVRKDSGKPLVARFVARRQVNSSPPVIPVKVHSIIEKAVALNWRGTCLRS